MVLKNKWLMNLSFIIVLSMVFTVKLFAGEIVDHRKRVINATSNKITITYIRCIFFEKQKLCSDEKSDVLFSGETKYYTEYPEAKYEIKKITNGIYTRNLGTTEDIKNNPADARKMPRCKIYNDSLIITQYFTNYFCERGGV